jgi:hypothetical protein
VTPEAAEMLEALNAPRKMDVASQSAEIKKLSATMNSLVNVFDEMLLADRVMFERMYLMNWCIKEKYRIVGEYLNVDADRIMYSPDREEVVRFTAEMVTAEVLAKVFSVAKIACGLSLNEFVFGWRVLNESGEMKYILFNSKIDIEKLHPGVKEAYLQDKKDKDSEDRIQQLMREEFLSNGGENDE